MFPYHIKIYQNTTILSQDTLRTIYISYFHSILWYGIIFWGNSPYSSNIFKIQKRIIRPIKNGRNIHLCYQLFTKLKILPLKSQYIFSFLLFIAKNRGLYESNSEIHNTQYTIRNTQYTIHNTQYTIHNINTRFSSDLHTATANLTAFQKVPFF